MTTKRWIAVGTAAVLFALFILFMFYVVMGGNQPDVIYP